MTPEWVLELTCLRRSRGFIDRNDARPLDVPAMAEAASMSPGHFSHHLNQEHLGDTDDEVNRAQDRQ